MPAGKKAGHPTGQNFSPAGDATEIPPLRSAEDKGKCKVSPRSRSARTWRKSLWSEKKWHKRVEAGPRNTGCNQTPDRCGCAAIVRGRDAEDSLASEGSVPTKAAIAPGRETPGLSRSKRA